MTKKKSKSNKIKHLNEEDYNQYIMSLKDVEPLAIYKEMQRKGDKNQ